VLVIWSIGAGGGVRCRDVYGEIKVAERRERSALIPRKVSMESSQTIDYDEIYIERKGESKSDNKALSNGVRRAGFSRVRICHEQRLVRYEPVLDRFPLWFHILKRLHPRRNDPTSAT